MWSLEATYAMHSSMNAQQASCWCSHIKWRTGECLDRPEYLQIISIYNSYIEWKLHPFGEIIIWSIQYQTCRVRILITRSKNSLCCYLICYRCKYCKAPNYSRPLICCSRISRFGRKRELVCLQKFGYRVILGEIATAGQKFFPKAWT